MLRQQSFMFTAPRLFNKLPRYLRDDSISTPDEWKSILDEFLSQIPDNPLTCDEVPGLCEPFSAKSTNSLTQWIPFLGLCGRRNKKDMTHKTYTCDSQNSV